MTAKQEKPHFPNAVTEPAYVQLPSPKGRDRNWIGISGYTLDQQLKTFVWINNHHQDRGLLQDPSHRNLLALRLTQLKADGIDAIIGPGIDFKRSKQEKRVVISSDSTALYIDVDHRHGGADKLKKARRKFPDRNSPQMQLIFKRAINTIPYV